MIILDLINSGSKKLKDNGIISNNLDSEILLSKVLNKGREELMINLNNSVSSLEIEKFYNFIKRRSLKEPIAYILKKKEFWSKIFFVEYGTLIPRPETELMVESILKIYKNKRPFILDIGTGSGCIILSLLAEIKNSKGIGIDVSQQATKTSEKNSEILGLENKVKFYKKSYEQIKNCKFDLIVSNPPYVKRIDLKNLEEDIKKFEPKLALDGGNDGLDVIKKIIYKSKSILKQKGMLALEIGNGQYKKVSKILKKNNFRAKYLIKDYRENVRIVLSILEF